MTVGMWTHFASAGRTHGCSGAGHCARVPRRQPGGQPGGRHPGWRDAARAAATEQVFAVLQPWRSCWACALRFTCAAAAVCCWCKAGRTCLRSAAEQAAAVLITSRQAAARALFCSADSRQAGIMASLRRQHAAEGASALARQRKVSSDPFTQKYQPRKQRFPFGITPAFVMWEQALRHQR